MKNPLTEWASASASAFYYNQGIGFNLLRWHGAALASFDKVLRLKPNHAPALVHRSAALHRLKRYEEALASCDQAIKLKPHNAGAYFRRGATMRDKGDMREAERMFEKALALAPNFAICLSELAGIRKYRDTDQADVKHMKSRLDNPLVSLSIKENLYFALGKVYDDCGLYDQAFTYYQKANRLRNRRAFYKPKTVTAYTDRIINTFDKDFLARPLAPGNPSSPVFIVGMPRSGTTLTAQILSNHAAVVSAGELSTIGELTSRLPRWTGKRIAYPEAARHIMPDLAAHLAAAYEQRLRRDAGPDVPFVIDKLPLNFRHLGFISMLFPKARIIHCTRHPLDTVLSNYFQQFQIGLDYSFTLRNIGHFYGQYAKLMAHWRNVLPIPILDIGYEDTIANTEQTIRRMLDFLGLEWDARCLAPHTNPAPVETASNWQVRQPIYWHSVERWRHYEKHLAPLKEMQAFLVGNLRPHSLPLKDQAPALDPSGAPSESPPDKSARRKVAAIL